MDAMNGQLPFMRVPHDTMREGLPGAKAGVTHLGKHPVQIIQEQGPAEGFCCYCPEGCSVCRGPCVDS